MAGEVNEPPMNSDKRQSENEEFIGVHRRLSAANVI